MQPTRPATATIATALALFLLANLAVTSLARSHPGAFGDWGSDDVAAKVLQIAALGRSGGADAVLLGDSTSGVGLLPSLIENRLGGDVTVYNASLNGSNPAVWSLWARDVVVPELKPSLVIIGVEAQNFTDAGPNTELYARYVHAPERKAWLNEQGLVDRVLSAVPLIRYRAALSRPVALLTRIRRGPQGCDSTDECLGWNPKRAAESFRIPDWWVDRYTSSTVSFTDGSQQAEHLRDLVNYLTQSGIGVAILEVPEMESLRPLNLPDPQRDFLAYQDQVRAVAELYDVPVLDANQLNVGLDDYADPHHLNRRGAEKLSVWVADQLRQHPELLAGR